MNRSWHPISEECKGGDEDHEFCTDRECECPRHEDDVEAS